MTTYTVEYGNERGLRTINHYTDWVAARDHFLSLTESDDSHGFPTPEGWDLIGYLTETVAQYGYVVPLGYTDETGHQTASIGYDRED